MAWIIESNSGNFYYVNVVDIINTLTFFQDNIDGVKSVKKFDVVEIFPLEPDTPIFYIVGTDSTNTFFSGLASSADASKLIETNFGWVFTRAQKTNYIYLTV